MVAARKSSPLVIGIGENGDHFLASDATPIVEHTKNVVYLEDGEIAMIDRGKGLRDPQHQEPGEDAVHQELEMHLETLEKGGYDHFMLKEIHEQPRSIRDSMRGRLNLAGRARWCWAASRTTSRSSCTPSASSSWPAAPAGTPVWWASTSSRIWPGSRWRWSMPASSATATRSSARTIS
jgi:glucosamine 6-phosphate synthetase-like amidotransferase/phosphosugar isomerase protein